MAKERSGYVFQEQNKWYARLTFTDKNGQRRNIKRRAETKPQAKLILKQLLREIEDYGTKSIEVSRMTFNDLADYYAEHYVYPAEYINDRKIGGLRDWKHVRGFLTIFRGHFGNCRLREITYDHIRLFRSKRLKTPTQYNRPRTITTVNRELTCLRRLLNIAEREGWIFKNPFRSGDSLICLADEPKRERILTREEETRLLTACQTTRRSHLRPIIICALDTGMRRGEMLKLRWRDVNLETRAITIQAFNTKTMKARQVSMTTRLARELQNLWNKSKGEQDDLVFGITDNVRKSFASACKEAGIVGFKFHDTRHSCATRLVALHLPLAEVGRVLGHTQPSTTYRYVNANVESAKRAAEVLDAFYQRSEIQETSEMIN